VVSNSDQRFRPGPTALIVAFAGPVALAALLIPFRSSMRTSNVALVLVIAVVTAAVLGGRIGGAIAAVMSALSYDFFFTHPYYSLTIDRADDLVTAILLVAVGLIVGEVVVRGWRSRAAAAESRREADRVRNVAQLAAGGETEQRLIRLVQRELVDVLHVPGVRFESPPFRAELPVLGHGSIRIPSSDASAAAESDSFVELPVYGEGRRLGRFVVELPEGASGVLLPPESRATAAALADQLGIALASGRRGVRNG
jgi:hypothetical protein